MFDEALGDLSDVLKRLKRADESLTEFVAPLWPGVSRAAAWLEGKARLYAVEEAPEAEDYYLLSTEGETARVIRRAEEAEARRYRDLLVKANVILLHADLAYPASFAERLQGITAPRPIHFAAGPPVLTQVQARFDGLNLLYDGEKADKAPGIFGECFSQSSIFTPGELLGIPGEHAGGSEAEEAQAALLTDEELATTCRLRAVLEPVGAVLESWSREDDGALRVTWRLDGVEHVVTLASAASPITSGICLPGTRGFDPAQLTRLLLDHALDAWQ